MSDIFQTVEVAEDYLEEMGLAAEIKSTSKNEHSYRRRIAMALRVRQLMLKLANDRPPGITIDVDKLPFTINTIYNYICSALTVLELYSTKEKFSSINQGYRTRMQGNTITVLSKLEYNKQRVDMLGKSVDAIDMATKVVSKHFSLKDELSEWLEDVGGEDRKIVDNIEVTLDEQKFLDQIKMEGIIFEWIYMKDVRILTVLRVREEEVEEEG
jgi:hypothetical protein